MPTVLSLVSVGQESVLDNHGFYAKVYGYQHESQYLAPDLHKSLLIAFKYHWITQQLRRLPDDEIVLFLDGDTLVKDPIDLNLLLGHDFGMVVEGPEMQGHKAHLGNTFVARNTSQTREIIHRLMVESGHFVAQSSDRVNETQLLSELGCRPMLTTVNDRYVAVSWRVQNWFQARAFLIHVGKLSFPDPHLLHNESVFHDPHLQRMLVEKVNAYLMRGAAVFPAIVHSASPQEPYSVYNAKRSIAFVTLFTHHIDSYARFSEQSLRRYCDRHAHTYHVYRATPEGLDPHAVGGWLKAALMLRHLADHDWVVWVDADVLVFNQTKKIGPLLATNELLFAKDVGGWDINSGIMCVKNTPENRALLNTINQRLNQVADRSSVYASQGDQFYINNVLKDQGLADARSISDSLTINTPSWFRQVDSFIVHYMGLGEPYRSALMAHDDTLSQRLG